MRFSALVLLLALWPPASPARPVRARGEDDAALSYRSGLGYYAKDDLARASAAFKETLRLDPSNAGAATGLRRVEAEFTGRRRPRRTGAAPPRAIPHPPSFDRFVLVLLPRWIHFEDTVGDALSGAGSVTALDARARQLLGERKWALARRRPFKNERQLRALLRRLPVAGGEPPEETA